MTKTFLKYSTSSTSFSKSFKNAYFYQSWNSSLLTKTLILGHRIWNEWHSFHYLVPIYEKVSRWGQCSWFGGQPQKEWTKAVLDDARGGFLSLHGLTWTTLLLSTKICNVFCELCDTNEWLQRPFCEYVFIYHVNLYSFSPAYSCDR